MRLSAFALFERSLRLETRSALMCWSRLGLLLLIFLFLVPTFSMARLGWIGAPGLVFLEEMIWANLVFITLAGLSYFASAITEEKEERMLGLLRMTDLNPIAILLGKSTSRLVGALLLLLTQIPFVLLAVTLGGVGPLQIAASYATLLAYLFLLCNLALLFSVVFHNTATAAAFTLGVLVLFLFGHYWAAAIEGAFVAGGQLNPQGGVWPALTAIIDLWRQATPSNRLSAIFRTGFPGPAIGFQVASNLALGILLFLLSWMLFDPCTREEKETAPFRLPLFGRTTRRSRIPPGVVGMRAVTWKDFTLISGGRFGLLLKFAVIVLLVVLFNIIALESGNSSALTSKFEGPALIFTSLIVTAVFLALEASRLFRNEIRDKTLSSLVLLPVSVSELAYRKVAGCLAGTLPLLAGVGVGLLMFPDALSELLEAILKEPTVFFALVVLILQFVLFLHLVVFLSLIIKRGALPLAVAIHYLGGTFLTTFMGIVFSFGGSGGISAMLFMVGIICVVLTILLHRGIGLRLIRSAAAD